MASFKNLISNTSAQISSGGTITGDLVINGDLQVDGGGSLSFDEIIEGTQVIDVTNTEALLVRKNGDGGDVFVVDTTNQKIGINTSSPDFALHVHGASDGAGYVKISDSNTGEGGTDGARIGFNSGVMRIQNFENSDMEFYVNNSTKPLVLESDGSATFSGNVITEGKYQISNATPELLFAVPSGGLDSRIHNDGSGNLIFGNGTNSATPTEAMRIDSNQNVGIGSSPIVRLGQKLSTATSANYGGASLNTYSTDNGHSSVLDFNKSGNATIGSHTAVADDEDLGYIIFRGSDGVEFLDACYIRANVDGAVTGGGTDDMPGRLTFWTAAHDSSSPTERIRIDSSGNVGVAEDDPDKRLHIKSSTSLDGIKIEQTGTGASMVTFFADGAERGFIGVDDSNGNALLSSTSGSDYVMVLRSAQEMHFGTNGNNVALKLDTSQNATFAGNVTIPAGNLLYLDGGTDTYIYQETDNKISFATNSGVRLSIDNSSSTFSNIVNVSGAGLKITGQNLAHVASSMTLGHEGSSKSQIRVYGADGTTEGSLEIVTSASDGTPSTTVMLLDSNSRISLSNNDSGGSGNTIFGKNCADGFDDGEEFNVVIGEQTAESQSHDSTDKNVFIGYQACTGGTGSRSESIAIGYQAWGNGGSSNNIGGAENVFIGSESGGGTWATAASDGNTAVGWNTMKGAMNGATLNTALGKNALKSLTTGDYNVVLGSRSGEDLTTGQLNTFVGDYAGHTTTDVDRAVAIGHESMGSGNVTSSGDGTVSIGYQALSVLTSGAGNTAVGYQSGTSITTGVSNTLLGYQAGDGMTVGEDNVAVGHSALGGASTSSENKRNVAVGVGSMGGTNAGASENVAIGYAALDANLTADADGNVAIGYYAGSAITEGEGNTIVGRNAADALTTGDKNIAIGRLALSTSQVSSNNIAIGYAAMNNTNDADSNGTVAIGYAALNNVTSGAGNVGVGYEVLKQVTTGKHNTAVGYQSMYNAMNVGDSNTSMGYQSLYSLDPDTDDHGSNTAVGKQSGYDVTTGTGNVLVGANAGNSGSNDLTTGDNNTYIGNEAAGASASNSNSTVIGATAIGSGSNTVTLGNANVTDVYMAQDSGATVHTAGIQFPASQVANSGANVLDDYEEGNGTPTVTMSTSGSVTLGPSPTTAWTKVGNLVSFQFEFSTTGVSSPVGAVQVQLPFTPASGFYAAGSVRLYNVTFDGSPFLAISPGNIQCAIRCNKTGVATTNVTPSAGTMYYFGQVTYRAA